jgi:outer membrane protein assembly factor BamD (BamD/ComL family)
MNGWLIRGVLIALFLLAFPSRSPAPFIYRQGEGWSYEPVGGETKWRMSNAKDQLGIAQAAFDKKLYGLALKAARRLLREWKLSDYAPQAQYLVGRCYEAQGKDEKAFKEYQTLLEKHPKFANYLEVLGRQYGIANRFLGGQWFKLWGYVPYRSMERTADLYSKIVTNGPYSDVAPQAQLNIGVARERERIFGLFKAPDYPSAVKAYELAADRYHDRPKVAAEALYRAGLAYTKQAQTAEYDQTMAGQAIATFSDFLTLYPNDLRAAETQKIISSLKGEQARGNFQTAKFYERYKRWRGAQVYYNEVLLQDPNSPYATEAKQRIDALKERSLHASK